MRTCVMLVFSYKSAGRNWLKGGMPKLVHAFRKLVMLSIYEEGIRERASEILVTLHLLECKGADRVDVFHGARLQDVHEAKEYSCQHNGHFAHCWVANLHRITPLFSPS